MCCHRRPGYSALVALESGFDLIILKNSLALIERVAELWDEFWRMGPDGVYSAASVPVWAHNLPGLNDMEWFDYVCWKQLDHEGWGRSEGKKLVPVRIQVPKGHVLWFNTWLMHAGAEHSDGTTNDIRLHYYVLPFNLNAGTPGAVADPTSVNMHICHRMADLALRSFCPALHFIPGTRGAAAAEWQTTPWRVDTASSAQAVKRRRANESSDSSPGDEAAASTLLSLAGRGRGRGR